MGGGERQYIRQAAYSKQKCDTIQAIIRDLTLSKILLKKKKKRDLTLQSIVDHTKTQSVT